MRVRNLILFDLYYSRKSVIIFYVIMLLLVAVFAGGAGLTVTVGEVEGGSLTGLEVSSMIFLFVAGCSSTEILYFGLQNGVARKEIWKAGVASRAVLSFGFAVAGLVISELAHLVTSIGTNLKVASLFEMTYPVFSQEKPYVIVICCSFLVNIMLFFAAFTLGNVITFLCLRLSKTARVVLIAGLPISVFAVLPALDYLVFDEALTRGFVKLLKFCFGYEKSQPMAAVLSMLILGAVLSVISLLLHRKVCKK